MLFEIVWLYELENRIWFQNLEVMIVGNSNGNDIAMDTCNKLIKLAEDSTALEIGNFGKIIKLQPHPWWFSNKGPFGATLCDDLIMPSETIVSFFIFIEMRIYYLLSTAHCTRRRSSERMIMYSVANSIHHSGNFWRLTKYICYKVNVTLWS